MSDKRKNIVAGTVSMVSLNGPSNSANGELASRVTNKDFWRPGSVGQLCWDSRHGTRYFGEGVCVCVLQG